MKRNIVKIDKEKCNGCGLCVSACAEGAIKLINGKAELITDSYCDGLGACLGECPQNAITLEERDAAEFDEAGVKKHLAETRQQSLPKRQHHGCPGMAAFSINEKAAGSSAKSSGHCSPSPSPSQLRQWPVQLHLVPVQAPYWNGADLLLAADCVSVAYADFQEKLLNGRKIIIACPKLDDTGNYLEKLAAILRENDIQSLTVARMEVPCCGGIVRLAQLALEASGKDIEFKEIIIGIDGTIKH
jgi:Pyruvate/2-oxoacid:ferredoxin oxidoreductase delta subunit